MQPTSSPPVKELLLVEYLLMNIRLVLKLKHIIKLTLL